MPITGQLLPGVKVFSPFAVSNSLMFNDDDTAYMTSPTRGTATSQKKGTFSFWIKLSEIGQVRMMGTYENSNNEFQVKLTNDSQLEIYQIAGGSNNLSKKTNRRFRDVSAWLHIVIAIDCTLTAGSEDVVKVYVNGTRETSFATNTNNMPLNHSFHGFYQGLTQRIGADAGSTSHTYDGYFAEFVYIDGQQLDADSFGEFDSDSPTIWKPIDVSGLTFGNNGYYLQFKQSGTSQNSSGLGADTSGNDNHFAVTNLAATDQSTDTCTNNSATMNPLQNVYGQQTFSNGNLQIVSPSGDAAAPHSTFGVSSGRWYVEAKLDSAGSNQTLIGVSSNEATQTDYHLGRGATSYGMFSANGKIYNNNDSGTAYGSGYSAGNILGIYLDLEDNKLYFSVNGSLQNSGTGHSITAATSTELGFYFFSGMQWDNAQSCQWSFNFGSPNYTNTSSNTDDNGYGDFEYSPNITGDGSAKKFYALNSKNLAEFG